MNVKDEYNVKSLMDFISSTYGTAVTDKYRSELEAMVEYVYSEPELTHNSFISYIIKEFDRNSYVEKRVAKELQPLPLWETTVHREW